MDMQGGIFLPVPSGITYGSVFHETKVQIKEFNKT
jgi:hypothetical protein